MRNQPNSDTSAPSDVPATPVDANPSQGTKPLKNVQNPVKTDAFENQKQKLYDKLPFTYKQVDIFVKVIIGLFAAFIVLLLLFGRGTAI